MLRCAIQYSFCSQFAFINWLQNHLLKCPFKYLTGIDCPGCGFQRSLLALINGDLHKSIILYPSTIPLLIFFAYGISDGFFNLDNQKHTFKKTGFILIGSMILISYTIKMWKLYHHYTTSA
jgi:hypothetical protein